MTQRLINLTYHRVAMKLTLNDIKEIVNADTISKRGDILTVRNEFYYTHGYTSEKFAALIKREFPHAEIIDHGEKWAPFRGGASTYNSSHWWVSFRLVDQYEGVAP